MLAFQVIKLIKNKKILSLGKTKIGHIGTLDPLAKGILPVIIGNDSTKFIDYVDDNIKTYEFRLKFGYKSLLEIQRDI